jgi:hypothetical protein
LDTCSVTFEELVDYHEGRSAAPRLGSHIKAGCSRCGERLAWLKLFLPALKAAVAEPPPAPSPEALARVRRFARSGTESSPFAGFAVLVARLVFDGRSSAPVGTRSSEGEAFQRVYETDDHVINLWEEPASRTSYVIGQVYAREDGASLIPASVIGTESEGARWSAEIQDSEFHFPALPTGSYELRLCVWDREVRLEDVRIGSGGS